MAAPKHCRKFRKLKYEPAPYVSAVVRDMTPKERAYDEYDELKARVDREDSLRAFEEALREFHPDKIKGTKS